MAKLILFGGGDGGGFIIGPNGVKPIPPFDPALMLQFRSISMLLRAERQLANADIQPQLASAINTVTNLLVSQVEDTVGDIDEEAGIVFQDADGGFTCGSTGKPPIPFPWPPRNVPSMEKLLSDHLILDETVAFLEAASEKKADLMSLFENPRQEAERLGINISPQAVSQLKALNLGNAERIADPVDREVISFFHATVKDGRYLKEWAKDPARVAKKIGVSISQKAADRIATVSQLVSGTHGEASIIWIVVGIVVIVAVVATEGEAEIIDLSGVAKF